MWELILQIYMLMLAQVQNDVCTKRPQHYSIACIRKILTNMSTQWNTECIVLIQNVWEQKYFRS